MSAARRVYGFVRWRLVPVRYVGKVRRSLRRPSRLAHRSAIVEAIETTGHAPGPALDPQSLSALTELFRSRAENVQPRFNGHVFQDLVIAEDFRPDHPLMRFAFSPQILDVAHDYFHGHFLFDSVQVLYSWPSDGPPRESQHWHRDYGDSRSLHCIAYLNDVATADGGPFVFVDKWQSRRIPRSMLVRRIPDDRFEHELQDGAPRMFLGRAGESVWVDPSACYHYGSRCKQPRLAVFVTFCTDTPYESPTKPIIENRDSLLRTGIALRPDLSEGYLRRLVQS